LYDCSAEKVILEKEVEYVKNYVAFHRLRKSENLAVTLEIENIEPGLHIAPLLLIVPIENAFKFVSNFSTKENKIEIKLSVAGTHLRSSFLNTKEVHQIVPSPNSNGIGIANLKRRLELLYPLKHNLTTNIESDFYETQLTIDLA
jgi:LytS/YehU family sensor histidine kinase